MRGGGPRFVVAASLLAIGAGACAYANGYDASRYPGSAPASSVDPEIEPLPPSAKQRMRDPRGVGAIDAGVVVATTAALSSRAVTHPAAANDAGADAAEATAVSAAVTAECGKKGDLCPMQRFMHGAMETAHTPETLTAAFTRVAGMSPDPGWAWVAIATRGADLANAGDVAASKAQCKACHDTYREKYRALHRARPL